MMNYGKDKGANLVHFGKVLYLFFLSYQGHPLSPRGSEQGLRASSLQFTSPLEFNAIFRDGFTLRHELTAGSEIRDPVPAKFKHVTNIVTCTCTMLWLRHVRAGTEISKKLTSNLGYRQKIHHFFFSYKWGTRFKYFSKLCPYILMYSALHIMQWFSQV